MAELNPAWIEAVQRTVNHCPYFELQSMAIVELGVGWSRLEIEAQQKHLQPFNLVHGGVLATLIDASGWWASYTEIDQDTGLTTLEMKLNYLAPAKGGRLVGHGRAVKQGKNVCLAEARVETESGRLLAHGSVTTMKLADLKINNQDQNPPKFR